MNLNECLRKALEDAHKLVEQGFWVHLDTFKSNVVLDWGVIHDNGELECKLLSKVYIAEVKNPS